MKLSAYSLWRIMDQKHPLSLVPLEHTDPRSRKFVTYSVPMETPDPLDIDANVPTVQIKVPVLTGDESVRTIIQWRRDIFTMINGLLDFEGEATFDESTEEEIKRCQKAANYVKHALNARLKDMLEGGINHQCHYRRTDVANMAATNASTERYATKAHNDITRVKLINFLCYKVIATAIDKVVEYLMPPKVGLQTRNYLLEECSKPRGMRVEEYYRHITNLQSDINGLPFQRGLGNLTKTQLKETLMRGCPDQWLEHHGLTKERALEDDIKILQLVQHLVVSQEEENIGYLTCLEHMIQDEIQVEVHKRRIEKAIEQGVNNILHPLSNPDDYPLRQFREDMEAFGSKDLIELLHDASQSSA